MNIQITPAKVVTVVETPGSVTLTLTDKDKEILRLIANLDLAVPDTIFRDYYSACVDHDISKKDIKNMLVNFRAIANRAIANSDV